MSHSTKLTLFSIFICCALGNPQVPDLPSSIQAQIYSIYPSQVPDGGYGSSYFSAHPAAYTTFEYKIYSLEAANPSIFRLQSYPSGGSGSLFSQSIPAIGGIPDLGLLPTQSAEFISAASVFAAPITGNPLSYISQHPGLFSSYIAEASSILGSDFSSIVIPTGAGGIGGAGGASLPTAPIFTMSPQGSQGSQGSGASIPQSTAGNTRITSQATLRTTQQASQQQQQQTATEGSQTFAPQTTNTDNKAPLQTPALALGFSGAAVAAVAGIAALL